MKTLSGKRRSVKAIAFILTLALILPMLPALPSFAAATKFESITFKGASDENSPYDFSDGDASDGNWLSGLSDGASVKWGRHFLTASSDSDGNVTLVGTEGTTGFSSVKAYRSFTFCVFSEDNYAVYLTVYGNEENKIKLEPNGEVDGFKTYTIAPSDYSSGNVTIEAVEAAPTYTVTLPTKTSGYTLSDYGEKPVASNEKFKFSVTVTDTTGKVPVVSYTENGVGAEHILNKLDTSEGKRYDYELPAATTNYTVDIVLMSALTVTYTGSSETTFTVSGYNGASVRKVSYGETLKFAIVPETGYTVTRVSVDGEPLTKGADGYYQIENVTEAVTVNVTTQPDVRISYTGNVGSFTVSGYDGANAYRVPYGAAEFKFKVEGANGNTVVQVLVDGEPLTKGTDGYYTIKNVTEAVTVNVVTEAAKLPVTFVGGQDTDEYTIVGSLPKSVAYNGEVKFTVRPTVGYIAPTVTYSVEGGDEDQKINPDGNTYTISGITGAITIKITAGVKDSYKVNIPGGNGYTVNVAGTVTDGSSLTVTVTLLTGYTQSTPQLVIGGVSYEMSATGVDNEYIHTITNVTSAVNGNITGVTLNTYNVTFPAATADYTVSASSTVKHGSAYTFTVTPSVGYDAPTVSYTVAGGTKTVCPHAGNTYTIPAGEVTGNITIEIIPADRTVTYPAGSDMYTIDGPDSVEYGKKLEFTVTVDKAYTQSIPVVSVTMNDATQTLVATKQTGATYTYTVNVTGNVVISVTGITQKNSYDVTLPASATGYTVSAITTTVKHGAAYSFTVTPSVGYGTPTVKCTTEDGVEEKVLSSGDNTYTIPEVTGNITITITAGDLIDCNISYDKNSSEYGITIDGNDTTVKYSHTLRFTVTMSEGYTQTAPTVTVTMGNSTLTLVGTATAEGNGYTYTVNNVTADVKIGVTATKNTYTVTYFTAGIGFTASASSNTVTHGDSFVFTVKVDDDFDPATLEVTGVTSVKTDEPIGQYVTVTITGVTDNVNISLTVAKKTAMVTASSVVNAEITIDAENNEVEYGTGFNVTVRPVAGYKVTGVRVVDSNSIATALVQTNDSTASNTVWYCDGVNCDNATIVVDLAPITVTVNWVTGGDAAWKKDFEYGDKYFEGNQFTLEGFTSERFGFDFKSWTIDNPTIGNEDTTVTVTGNWSINAELFTLKTTVIFDSSAKQLAFMTSVVINSEADEEAKRDYASATIEVAGCGFFYGANSTVLNNDVDCIADLKAHLKKVDWNKKYEKQAVDGFDNRVYFYNSTKAATTEFEIGKNTYTVNFNFKNPTSGVSRSGVACLNVKIGEDIVTLLGDAVYYTVQ